MNTYQAKEFVEKEREYSAETLLFLRPEQIRLFSAVKKGRGSENARIRMAKVIQKYGVLQPFSVRIWQEGNGFTGYQLLSDEERFRAVCLAGIERIPCKLVSSEEKQCAELALLAELREKKLHFLDEARILEDLTQKYHMKQSEIAEKLGSSQSTIANKLRLLQLNDWERESIRRAGLGERHARALLRLTDPPTRQKALECVILRQLSVAETEQLAEELLSPEDTSPGEVLNQGGETRSTPPFERKSAEFKASFGIQKAEAKSSGARRIAANIPEPAGIRPSKFILHDLQPLYNSIERTLSIFRKTGMEVECCREERADGVQIYINIPKSAGRGH